MEETKFECSKCGKCCNPSYAKYPIINKKIKGLPLFEWECARLKQLAQLKGIELDIRLLTNFTDLKSKSLIIESYMLNLENYESCPFLQNNLCSIYSERPFVCKSFPLIESPTTICPDCPEVVKLKKSIEKNSNPPDMFGDSYLFSLQRSLIFETFMELKVNLQEEGKIKIASEKDDLQIYQLQSKSFFNFLFENQFLSKDEINNLIISFEDCEQAKEIIKNNTKNEKIN